MGLKTYGRSPAPDGAQDVIIREDGFIKANGKDLKLKPGSTVKHYVGGGYGIVVAINDEQITVLWSQEPEFEDYALPPLRKATQQMYSQKLVAIQPMSMPTGLIFYQDYTYGSGSK